MSNWCVRCYTKKQEKVLAEMIFKGASCCMGCVDEMMALMKDVEEKMESKIIKPEGVN